MTAVPAATTTMTAVPAALALAALLAVAAAAPDLELVGKCSDKCIRTFNNCWKEAGADFDVCVFDKLIDCHCDCRKHLEAKRAALSGLSAAAERGAVPPVGLPACDDVRTSDASEKAVGCFNVNYIGMTDCAKPCISTQDVECATKCVVPGFEKICACNVYRPAVATTVAPPPPPTVDPSGSAYAQFSQCHAGCQGRYQPCVAACNSPACIAKCVFDVIACDCGCKKYVDSARGLLEQRRQRTPAVLDRGLAAALTASLGGLRSEESEAAATCYDESIDMMDFCIDSCASGDEACASRCAKTAFTRLCTCSAVPKTTAPPTTVAPPTGPPSPLNLFGKCHVSCMKSYRTCQSECKTNACLEQCLYDNIVDCNCACKKYLDGSSMLDFVASVRQTELSSALAPFGSTRSVDDANYTIKCYNAAVDEMTKCTAPCTPTHDEACATKCVKPAFEKICNCNRLKPYSTPKPAPPTRPPTTPPRPRPPTTAQPPATTPASAGGLQGHLLVVAVTALLALLARQ